MKFQPFTPSKYLFALHFKMKFPPLPTSKLALAFRPPYPKGLPCDSLLGMNQKLKTKDEDKVTATKCNLYTFRAHLHLDLPHIRIISLIGIGKKSFNYLETNKQHLYKIRKCYLSVHPSACSCSLKVRR